MIIVGCIFCILLIFYLIKNIFGTPGKIFVDTLGWILVIILTIVLIIAGLFFSLKNLVKFDTRFTEPLSWVTQLIDNFKIKSPFANSAPGGNETIPNSPSSSSDNKDSSDNTYNPDSSDKDNTDNTDNTDSSETSLEELAEKEDKLKKEVSDILSKETENKDSIVLNRNFSIYSKELGADTKSNQKEDLDFFSRYAKQIEFNHLTSAEAEYSNISFTIKLKEKKGKLICTIDFANAKNFNGTFRQLEDTYVSGPLGESKKPSSVFPSIKDLFMNIHQKKLFDSMFNEHGHIEEMSVAKDLIKLGYPIIDAKKEKILKELATNSCFSDIYTVKLNDKVYLKKDGIVKRNFTTDEIESIFGQTKKKEKNVEKKANRMAYIAITSTLCYNSSSSTSAIELIQIAENTKLDGLIYSNVNENARATAQNGKSYFQIFEQIKNKEN